jgi:hypothetical protein
MKITDDNVTEPGQFTHPCECDREGGNRHEYGEGCSGWNDCLYCDNGWFPCNLNCAILGATT